jgi:transcriptional regulator with XRE-family HTH domain
VKLSEIAEAAGCSKASASDIRRGRRTPHVSTWTRLAGLARVEVVELGPSGVDSSLMKKASCTD